MEKLIAVVAATALAFILTFVIDMEAVKIPASFLLDQGKYLHNALFCQSCIM